MSIGNRAIGNGAIGDTRRIVPAAGGGGFSAAWARVRSGVIGGGLSVWFALVNVLGAQH